MNFSVKSTPYLGSLVRAPSGLGPSAVYDFSGAVYNRFSGGGMTAQPTEYTIAGWFKPKSVAGYAGIAVRSNGNPAGAWTHTIYQNLGSQWIAYAYDGATRYVYSTTAPKANTWAHVVATAKNGGFERLYVNGVEEGTPSPVGTLWTGGNDWWVAVDDGSTGTNYVGYMCDFAIWNKQLSASEIASLTTGVRGLPLTVQPANLLMFCPMDDAPIGGALVGDWEENVGGLTQTRTGAPVGRLDTPAIPPPPTPPTTDSFESYAVGWLFADGTLITGGTGWNGAASIYTPTVATDNFEYYLVGTITDAGTISAGTNWSGGAVQVAGMIAMDSFESYGTGPVYNGSNITSGVYWNGAAQLY